jgi:hypothetical protein
MSILKLSNLNSPLEPKIYNIVQDYPWTNTPSTNRTDVPVIILKEYEQDVCTLWAQIAYWIDNLKLNELEASENPYKSLYHAIETKAEYILPYFETYDHNISQDWQKTKGVANYSLAETALNIFSAIEKFRKIAPGTSINQPQVWSGSGAATYTVNFTLFNTGLASDQKSLNDIIRKNLNFKRRLLMATLHDQRTAILSSPPALFEVLIPGIRISPAAVISQLTVSNIGQMNQLTDINNIEEIFPDAWEFNIQITELISESRQILNAVQNGRIEPVRAIVEQAGILKPPVKPNPPVNLNPNLT